jgi:hypothetical protein
MPNMSAEDNWATTADLMEARNLLTRDADLRLLEAVVLIANTDRHYGNISLLLEGTTGCCHRLMTCCQCVPWPVKSCRTYAHPTAATGGVAPLALAPLSRRPFAPHPRDFQAIAALNQISR